jgi:hypothetical protein
MAKSRGRVFDYLSATGYRLTEARELRQHHGKVGVATPTVQSRDACFHAKRQRAGESVASLWRCKFAWP